jgi:hypothetical protein
MPAELLLRDASDSESVLPLIRPDGSCCGYKYWLRVAAPQRSGRIFLAGEMTGCCGADQDYFQGLFEVPPNQGQQTVLGGLCADPLRPRGKQALHGGPEYLPLAAWIVSAVEILATGTTDGRHTNRPPPSDGNRAAERA